MFECWLLFKRVGLPASMRLTTVYGPSSRESDTLFWQAHIQSNKKFLKIIFLKKRREKGIWTASGKLLLRRRGGKKLGMMILLTIPIKVQAGGTLELAASGPSETVFQLWNDTGGFPASTCRYTRVRIFSLVSEDCVFPCIWGVLLWKSVDPEWGRVVCNKRAEKSN